MKRILSSVLVLVMAAACCCGIASARASLTLSAYYAMLFVGDTRGEISIDYEVRASLLADSLGVESIRIFEEDGTYVTTINGTIRSGLICVDSDVHKGYYDKTLTAGTSYYAEVTIFARQGIIYDSRTITTNTVTAPY